MADAGKPGAAPVTVAECRQAIKVHEWELLRLVSDLAEQRRRASRHRRGLERGRRICALLWRRCRDQIDHIELLRDLIRSSPDGSRVPVEEAVQSFPAGAALLERIGQMMDTLDTGDDQQVVAFFRQLEDLDELAKDLFDWAGAKLVHELDQLLDEARQAPIGKLRELLARVERLRGEADGWFQ